jgi:epoxyqueuosine reductase
MQQNLSAYSQLIKTEAKNLGFLFCGIAKAEFLEEEAPRLEAWLKQRHARRNALHGKLF